MARKWSAAERAALIGVLGVILVTILSFVLSRKEAEPVQAAQRPAPESQSLNPTPTVTNLKIPFPLDSEFHPSGWMGDGKHGTEYLSVTDIATNIGSEKKIAIKIRYRRGTEGWAGVYWQHPDKNWGEQPGLDLTGAQKITFMARGENGGEIVEFKAGGIGGKYPDTFRVSIGKKSLTKTWQLYEINLAGENLSNVVGALAWAGAAPEKGELIFYIADPHVR